MLQNLLSFWCHGLLKNEMHSRSILLILKQEYFIKQKPSVFGLEKRTIETPRINYCFQRFGPILIFQYFASNDICCYTCSKERSKQKLQFSKLDFIGVPFL